MKRSQEGMYLVSLDSEKPVKIDAKKMMKARAYLFFVFGFMMLGLFFLTWNDMDIIRMIMFGFIVVLLFFGAIITFIISFKTDDQKKELDFTKPVFQCRHCREEFNSEKIKDKHEKSCVKMRI